MTRRLLRACLLTGLGIMATAMMPAGAQAQTKIRVGWCAGVITHGVAPFAVASKMGWFKQAGIEVELVNFPGSSDCVRNVATGEVQVAVASGDPVAILQQTGVKTQIYYTAYRRNIFGIAVPEDSPIKTYADLKDKKIGVISMGSVGVVVARSVATDAGLNPDRDIRIVVSGQPGQSVVLLKRKEIDAVSQWDTQYTLMGIAGQPMRMVTDDELASYPANSFVTSPDALKTKREQLVALARAYTLGVMFVIENPRKAAAIFQDVYPQMVPSGLTPEQALDQNAKLVKTVAEKWSLEAPGVRWGESKLDVYQKYIDWLTRAKILKQSIPAGELVNNDLIDAINDKLDVAAVKEALAR